MSKVLLGDMLVEFKGEGSIATAVRREFACLKQGEGTPHLSVYIVSALPPWDEGEPIFMVGDLSAISNSIDFAPEAPCRLRMHIDSHGNWHVWCNPQLSSEQRAQSRLSKFRQRWRSRSYLTSEESVGVSIVFGPLAAILHLRLLSLGGALVHGAALAREGKGVLLSGWGGCGKTSLIGTIAVLGPSDWEYLGDDLVLLDSKGRLGLVPLAIHLKSYNLTPSPDLYKRLSRGRSRFEHWHWLYKNRFGTLKPMRRALPNELFSLPTNSRPLCLAIHLDRYSGEELVLSKMSANDFSTAVAAGTLNEYKCILGGLLKAQALPLSATVECLPGVLELWVNTERIVRKHVGEAAVWRIRVPSRWDSNRVGMELAEIVKKMLDSVAPRMAAANLGAVE